MDSDKNIRFDEAWKEFLIIRGIPYKIPFLIYLDSNHKVVKIQCRYLPIRKLEGKEYFCDDSTTSMTLVYPQDIFLSEAETKIVKHLLGKRLEKQEVNSIIGKGKHFEEKLEARLGTEMKSGIQKLVSEKQYWEASFSLHQILEHRLRKMLMYKSMKIDPVNQKIVFDDEKEKICETIKTFRHLTNLAFLTGAISKETRKKILHFNSERGNIAHDILKADISRQRIEKLCEYGLNLMDTLEKHFSQIIPKPKFIRMKKLEIRPFKEPN